MFFIFLIMIFYNSRYRHKGSRRNQREKASRLSFLVAGVIIYIISTSSLLSLSFIFTSYYHFLWFYHFVEYLTLYFIKYSTFPTSLHTVYCECVRESLDFTVHSSYTFQSNQNNSIPVYYFFIWCHVSQI